MTRVLDLDLDFFLWDVCALAPVGQRPPSGEALPWDEARVRAFLEKRCGLSTMSKVPGRVFVTHDQALDFWADMMGRGQLAAPFHLTHVDAHSDLGIGRPGPAYVLESVLAQRPQARVDLAKYRAHVKLDEANYLLFALAFGWIADLVNVRNPMSRPDVPPAIVAAGGGALRLQSTLGRLLPQYDYGEPVVPYRAMQGQDFVADAPYHLASLALSPRYAPPQADFIRDIFWDYATPL